VLLSARTDELMELRNGGGFHGFSSESRASDLTEWTDARNIVSGPLAFPAYLGLMGFIRKMRS